MMKFHKPGRLRMLGGAAVIATLGGLSLAFGSAGAVAQPSPPAPAAAPSGHAPHGDAAEGRRERVIVHTIRTDEHRDHRDHRGDGASAERRGGGDGERRVERNVRVITTGDRDGQRIRTVDVRDHDGHPVHTVVVPRDCDRGGQRSEVNEGTDNNRTRVIVCTRSGAGEGNPAQHAEALQRARERLSNDSDIPSEQRQRVLAAIDRELARLRNIR